MAVTIKSSKILLVSRDASILEATRNALLNEQTMELVDKAVTSENLNQVINETQPDLILLDYWFQLDPLLLIDKLTSQYPSSALVALLPESEISNSDRVVLSGARAFVQYPYQSETLVTTARRVLELMQRNIPDAFQTNEQNPHKKTANTFTVFSPKGGVGSTTVATNLAVSLHKTINEDVLLIDGKHLFGHVALYLNLRTGNSITDLISHAGLLDEGLIKQVVERHISGISVLPSPNAIVEAQGIKPENLFKVLQSLQQVYTNIIIDGGNNLNDNTVTYMDSSDKILLILNSDLASMRDARQFMEISATLSYPIDKILLILNQTGRKSSVKKEEIENILKMKIFGKIPADEFAALSSLNEGVPILVKKPKHPISKAFNEITKEIVKIIQTSRAG